MKISTQNIISFCEQAKKARLARQRDAYAHCTLLCVEELKSCEFLPDSTQVAEVMNGGRVNYFTAKLSIGNKRFFAKMSRGGLESRFLKHMRLGSVAVSGNFFSTPKCIEMIEIGPVFLYLFEYFDGLDSMIGAEQDEIRLLGLSEFNARNISCGADDVLSGIPRHYRYIRSESINKLDSLGMDEDIISNQKRILSNWSAVLPVLKKANLCLCIRDSGRQNVCVRNEKAALIDFGAVHYAPLGFDMWSYLMKSSSPIDRASEIAETHYSRHELKGISTEKIAITGVAAASIMGLDRFLGSPNYASAKKIGALQRMTLDLLEFV